MNLPGRNDTAESAEAATSQKDATAGAPTGADPTAFRLRGGTPKVMRLSCRALASLGVLACFGIGTALIYALRSPHSDGPQNPVEFASRNRADSVIGAPRDYSQVPKLGQAMPGDLGRPILSAQQNGAPIPVPPMGSTGSQSVDPRLAEAEQVRQRVLQEHDSARTSRLFLAGASSSDGDQPIVSLGSPPSADQPASATPIGKRAFMDVAANRTTISNERVTAPVSPYIVQAGSVIPAAMLTGIQSDLPGQISAQVTRNVYDSLTGKILLIPQGARLIGEYDSEVTAGQSRVLLAWDRLIFPDGRSILLDRQPGADTSGMAGLRGRVDYHWGNMVKAALVSTLLGVGSELASGSNDDLVRALREGTQDTVSQTGRQVVQRQVNVPPTLTIAPGHVLRVIVTRDLVLDPVAKGGI